MTEESFFLLNMYNYGEEPDNKYFYTLCHINSDIFDYRIKHLDVDGMVHLYKDNKDKCDFRVDDGFVFCKAKLLNTSETIAQKALRSNSITAGLKDVSIYEVLFRLSKEKIHFLSDEFMQIIRDQVGFFPFEGVCRFSDLMYAENSLNIIAPYTIKGVSKHKKLVESTAEGIVVNNFYTIAKQEELTPLALRFLEPIRTVTSEDKVYTIYTLNKAYTGIPMMDTLGSYTPNLICMLKYKSILYHNLSMALTLLLIKEKKSKVHGPSINTHPDLEDLDDSYSTKVIFSIPRDSEGIRNLLVPALSSNKVNILSEEHLRNFVESTSQGEVEEFVKYNILRLEMENTESLSVKIKLYQEALIEANKIRSFYELMLMMQRASMTVRKPPAAALRATGSYGLTNAVSKIQIGG